MARVLAFNPSSAGKGSLSAMRAVLVTLLSTVSTQAFLFGNPCDPCSGGLGHLFGGGGYGGASYAPSYTSYAPQTYAQPQVYQPQAPTYQTLYAGQPYFTPVGAQGGYATPSYTPQASPVYTQILPLPAGAQIVSNIPAYPAASSNSYGVPPPPPPPPPPPSSSYVPSPLPPPPASGGYATGPSYHAQVVYPKPVYHHTAVSETIQEVAAPAPAVPEIPAPAPVPEVVAPAPAVHTGYTQPASQVQPYVSVPHARPSEYSRPSFHKEVTVVEEVPSAPEPVVQEKTEVIATPMINSPEAAGYRRH